MGIKQIEESVCAGEREESVAFNFSEHPDSAWLHPQSLGYTQALVKTVFSKLNISQQLQVLL